MIPQHDRDEPLFLIFGEGRAEIVDTLFRLLFERNTGSYLNIRDLFVFLSAKCLPDGSSRCRLRPPVVETLSTS
jgi:hypothetical protein